MFSPSSSSLTSATLTRSTPLSITPNSEYVQNGTELWTVPTATTTSHFFFLLLPLPLAHIHDYPSIFRVLPAPIPGISMSIPKTRRQKRQHQQRLPSTLLSLLPLLFLLLLLQVPQTRSEHQEARKRGGTTGKAATKTEGNKAEENNVKEKGTYF
jgi:hypothetical protein